MNEAFDRLMGAMAAQPVISTHCHHLPDAEFRNFTLYKLLSKSYVQWMLDIPETPDARRAFVEKLRFNAYYTALTDGLSRLYGLDERLNAENWASYERLIEAAHKDPDWHLKILTEHCCFEKILLDAYWKPGSDNGHPELFAPVFRK